MILRFIEGETRGDRKVNVDIRKELVINHDMVELVRQRRLRYFGHVVRMIPFRTPNFLLYGRVGGQETSVQTEKAFVGCGWRGMQAP